MDTLQFSRDKREKLAIGFALVSILAVGIWTALTSISDDAPENSQLSQTQNTTRKNITAQKMQSMIEKKEPLAVLDIRSEEEFVEEHILDAKRFDTENIEHNELPPRDRPIILVAASGDDPMLAMVSEYLVSKGFSDLNILSGGMKAWAGNIGQTVSAGDPTSFLNQAKVSFISPEDLKNSLQSKSLQLIDARVKESFLQGHISGAINIPFEEIERRRDELSNTSRIIVYDEDEVQAFQSAVRVFDSRFLPAWVLEGGLKTWKEKGFELVR